MLGSATVLPKWAGGLISIISVISDIISISLVEFVEPAGKNQWMSGRRRLANFLGRVSAQRTIVLGVVLVIAAAALLVPGLASIDNIAQVLRQIAVPGIMAIGVTFVVIVGRLDLTVGALLSLCAVTMVDLHDIVGPGEAIAVTLAVGLLSGCVSGFLVAVLGVNSLIATLGMMSLLQGLTLVYTNGKNAQIAHPEATWFGVLGRGYLFGVPVPVVILAVLAAVMAIVLNRTTFGRKAFAVGGNETASAYSSVNVKGTIFLTYVISAVMTALAAIVYGSRVMAGQNDSGSGLELFVLSGVILGGTSLLGGSGGIGRSTIGIVILGFVQNVLLLIGLPYFSQWIVTWIVIIVAVWADMVSKRARVFA
jgi:ribose transport system permease protein